MVGCFLSLEFKTFRISFQMHVSFYNIHVRYSRLHFLLDNIAHDNQEVILVQ